MYRILQLFFLRVLKAFSKIIFDKEVHVNFVIILKSEHSKLYELFKINYLNIFFRLLKRVILIDLNTI